MPRAKQKAKSSDPNAGRKYYLPTDAPWGGFVDLRLEESERGDFDGWYTADVSDWTGVLQETLVDGMALSVKYDADSSCFTASLLGKGVASDDGRYCLVARGATWEEAIALVIYKHAVLMDGDWSNYRPKSRTLSKFG